MPQANVMMHVRRVSPTTSVIDIEGDVSAFAENVLMDAYTEANTPTTRIIIMNFSKLAYMNSSGIGLLVTLTLISLGAWYYVRRSRRALPTPVPAANPDTPALPQEAAPIVSFACPGCRKTIKARAELAGKKGKCPQCGKVLVVPRAQTGEADRAPVEDRFKA